MYLYFLCFIISSCASVIGAICGIGGGVLIKPLLDSFAVMDVATINFLSGCTVLSMACYSVCKSMWSRETAINIRTGTPMALGAAFGGMIGKVIFNKLMLIFQNQNLLGGIQSICLMVITGGTLLYVIKRKTIPTYQVTKFAACMMVGVFLGILSSFLGIGGGPVNLVVLYFFFSMNTKTAAQNSLYIIFFSQSASLVQTIITQSVPEFKVSLLVLMILGGLGGGVCGRKINKHLKNKTVDQLFIISLIAIGFVCIYNTVKYFG